MDALTILSHIKIATFAKKIIKLEVHTHCVSAVNRTPTDIHDRCYRAFSHTLTVAEKSTISRRQMAEIK